MSNKAIYKPKGKAAEYAKYACNFYVGCSNNCTYCYLKKGRGKAILGGDKPTLKKCFISKTHALTIFQIEVTEQIDELRKHGLFFSFTTDPMLPETVDLTFQAIRFCNSLHIPVKILSKSINYIHLLDNGAFTKLNRNIIAFGFSLTGRDECEPNASSNGHRVYAMSIAKDLGYKTFASIEPIIHFESSFRMIKQSRRYCDLYLLGLNSGQKYDVVETQTFVENISDFADMHNIKIHMKQSLQKLTHYTNKALGFVEHDYNLFSNPQNS